MKLKKFVMIPVIIGILAFLIQTLDQWLSPMMQPSGNVGFSWDQLSGMGNLLFSRCQC
jgi:hypothetical protein